eukprot:Filipodium_phascolosomae@DN2667_c0_g2_i1.p2
MDSNRTIAPLETYEIGTEEASSHRNSEYELEWARSDFSGSLSRSSSFEDEEVAPYLSCSSSAKMSETILPHNWCVSPFDDSVWERHDCPGMFQASHSNNISWLTDYIADNGTYSWRLLNHVRRQDGATALSIASLNGCLEAVRFLLEHGAEVNTRDRLGNNSMHYAHRGGFTDIVEELSKAGSCLQDSRKVSALFSDADRIRSCHRKERRLQQRQTAKKVPSTEEEDAGSREFSTTCASTSAMTPSPDMTGYRDSRSLCSYPRSYSANEQRQMLSKEVQTRPDSIWDNIWEQVKAFFGNSN